MKTITEYLINTHVSANANNYISPEKLEEFHNDYKATIMYTDIKFSWKNGQDYTFYKTDLNWVDNVIEKLCALIDELNNTVSNSKLIGLNEFEFAFDTLGNRIIHTYGTQGLSLHYDKKYDDLYFFTDNTSRCKCAYKNNKEKFLSYFIAK